MGDIILRGLQWRKLPALTALIKLLACRFILVLSALCDCMGLISISSPVYLEHQMYYRDDVPKLLLVRGRRAGAVVLFIDDPFQPLHHNRLYNGMCLILDMYSLCCFYLPLHLFSTDPSTCPIFFFYFSCTNSALSFYPFIFLWILIPTVNKILHLNTNEAICMTANPYQKNSNGYCVVCETSVVFVYVLFEYQGGRWSVWCLLYVY